MDSTIGYPGAELEDALSISEGVDVSACEPVVTPAHCTALNVHFEPEADVERVARPAGSIG